MPNSSKKRLIFICLALTCRLAVALEPTPGRELQGYLEEYLNIQNGYSENPAKAGMFLGYVRGVLDALDGTALCIPKNVPITPLMQKIIQYIGTHTAEQADARTLVFEGLRSQFSCQQK